jgi:uncharacterized protein (TIGR03437 family)
VRWNGLPIRTTYIAYDHLTATGPGSGSGNLAFITVVNPDSESIGAAQTFEILDWDFARCSPSSAVAGGPSFSVTASGQHFLRGAVVRWSGTPLETAFVDANTLVATVPAALIASAGVVPITVLQPDGAVSSAIDFAIRPASPSVITIAPGGVVNAASSQPSIAPGSLISIYASNLPPRSSFAESTPLPLELNGVSVLINGVRAPLLFAGSFQVNAQVPYEIPPGPATLVLNAGTVKSESAPIDIKPAGPGILTFPATNHALAQNAADFTLNSTGNPARSGQYVILYLTGQGLVEPTVATGAAALSSPLSYPIAKVDATIGGRPATVAFAGLAPGMVGVLQVNLLVPSGASGELSVEISIGGVASPPALLSVGAN